MLFHDFQSINWQKFSLILFNSTFKPIFTRLYILKCPAFLLYFVSKKYELCQYFFRIVQTKNSFVIPYFFRKNLLSIPWKTVGLYGIFWWIKVVLGEKIRKKWLHSTLLKGFGGKLISMVYVFLSWVFEFFHLVRFTYLILRKLLYFWLRGRVMFFLLWMFVTIIFYWRVIAYEKFVLVL